MALPTSRGHVMIFSKKSVISLTKRKQPSKGYTEKNKETLRLAIANMMGTQQYEKSHLKEQPQLRRVWAKSVRWREGKRSKLV